MPDPGINFSDIVTQMTSVLQWDIVRGPLAYIIALVAAGFTVRILIWALAR
jgi:16S rRNA C1402 (ribose-2'-O) methylase RsmI